MIFSPRSSCPQVIIFSSPGHPADQPAELYEKHDANGNFEKHGVSQDASKRYSKKEVNGGTVKVTERGPRKEMLKKERQKVETNPGPKNKEPWAGKKKDPNQP